MQKPLNTSRSTHCPSLTQGAERIYRIEQGIFTALDRLDAPLAAPDGADSFLWWAIPRSRLASQLDEVQKQLQNLCGSTLLDFHVRDVLNEHLPSHYDWTTRYDVLIIRGLRSAKQANTQIQTQTKAESSRPFTDLQTDSVSYIVTPQLLLTVHPSDDLAADSLLCDWHSEQSKNENPHFLNRRTYSPADLCMRLASLQVDAYLALRRNLSQQLEAWQNQLIHNAGRFKEWHRLLKMRLYLQQLSEVANDQCGAVQDWIDELEREQVSPSSLLHTEDVDTLAPLAATAAQAELLLVRSRDVLEHIERVVTRVERLEQSAETMVQMHFSAQTERTNSIMQVLTVLTAIFLPLNLITGFFGMNFDSLPFIHEGKAVAWVVGIMLALGFGMTWFFWRKRYLRRTD